MRRHWWLGLALGLITLAVFGSVLRADFVRWDDDINIYRNPHLGPLSLERVLWAFTDPGYVRYYAPLSWLSVLVVHQFFGLNPLGYHLLSLLLHSANVVLVFLVTRRLLRLRARSGATEEPVAAVDWGSAAGALVWGLHPLRAEAVAWATGVSYCLATLLLLLSLCSYLEGCARATQDDGRQGARWRLAAVLAFGLSLVAYPIGLAYGAVLLVVDGLVLKRLEWPVGWQLSAQSRRVLLEKLPYVALTLVMLGVTLHRRIHVGGLWTAPTGLEHFGWESRLAQAFYIWAYYVWKPLAPFGLSPVYTTLVWFDPWDLPFVASAALVAALGGLLVWQRRRWPGLLALWLCHLALLVPLLGLTEHPHYPSDRYGYLQGILWSVLVAAGLLKLGRRPGLRAVTPAVTLAVLMALGWLTHRQARVWQNSVTLFGHVLERLGGHPYSVDIHWRLGGVFAEQGRTAEALAHYAEALRIQPAFVEARLGAAELLEQQGQAQDALDHYRAAAQANPRLAVAHAKAGLLLARLGRAGEALDAYRQALRIEPDYLAVLNNLAWMLATSPETAARDGPEAVRLASRACELTRHREATLVGTLAAAQAECGRFEEAQASARKAIALAEASGRPELANLNRQLLELYAQHRPFRETNAPAASGVGQ